FSRPLTKFQPSHMRCPSSAMFEPRIPGSTKTAGRCAPGGVLAAGARTRARVPLASSPAQERGPMGEKEGGCSCSSPSTIADAGQLVEIGPVLRDTVQELHQRG